MENAIKYNGKNYEGEPVQWDTYQLLPLDATRCQYWGEGLGSRSLPSKGGLWEADIIILSLFGGRPQPLEADPSFEADLPLEAYPLVNRVTEK